MDLQEALALLVVAITAALFIVSVVRRRSTAAWKRSSGCGCSSAPPGSAPRVTISGRKGEAPRITVR